MIADQPLGVTSRVLGASQALCHHWMSVLVAWGSIGRIAHLTTQGRAPHAQTPLLAGIITGIMDQWITMMCPVYVFTTCLTGW